MTDKFEKWLINNELKSTQTAYNYVKAINRISKHYSNQINGDINLYSIDELSDLKSIANLYGTTGKYSEFGHIGNGTNRAAINSLCRFRENNLNLKITNEIPNEILEGIESVENSNNFSYERDLKNSLVYQIEELFPEYKIFGHENEGIEYLIDGKRVDILLEKRDGSLLAVELKSGIANFKVFGQISMYIGLLMNKFPEKKIAGCIVAGEIDKTLKCATRTTDIISLMTYSMKLELQTPE